jgi:hypothetical protein
MLRRRGGPDRARARARAGAAFPLLFALLACDTQTKREAGALVVAVERFRVAANDDRPHMVEPVRAAPCSEAEVCDAKAACLAMIEPTVRAILLEHEVAARLDDIEHGRLKPDDPIAVRLRGEIDEAERLLKEGRAAMDGCDKRTVADATSGRSR